MVPRYKKLSSQLGKKIQEPGAHLAHAAVGILLKRRSKENGYKIMQHGGSRVKPIVEYNPYPMEFLDASM